MYPHTHTHTHTHNRLLLGDGAKLFTILRDPTDVFASGYDFFQLQAKTGLSLTDFIRRWQNSRIRIKIRK